MPCDYSRYPPDWKTGIVPRILARANDRCEFCGVENKALIWSVPLMIRDRGKYKMRRMWVSADHDMERLRSLAADEIKRVRVVLTIAHLDHDETNHAVTDDRLAALCQSCHIGYDAHEKVRRLNVKAAAKARQDALPLPV